MQNAGLNEAQTRSNIAGRNTNNLRMRFSDENTLMAERGTKEPLEAERGE